MKDVDFCAIQDSDHFSYPIGSMYAIYGNIYHQYIPNVSIYTIHASLSISTSDTKSVDLGSNSLNLTVPDNMCTSFP